MRHLDRETLLDLAEGRTSDGSAHVTSCEACRRQVDELRGVLSAIHAVDVPEPSPLFWDHLSARVLEQVRSESPARGWGLWQWTWRLAVPFGAVLALIVAVAVWTHRGIEPAGSPVLGPAAMADLSDRGDIQSDDPSLALLTDLAETVNVDDASAAGLAPESAAIDREVGNLTADERDELRSILKQELSKSGA